MRFSPSSFALQTVPPSTCVLHSILFSSRYVLLSVEKICIVVVSKIGSTSLSFIVVVILIVVISG